MVVRVSDSPTLSSGLLKGFKNEAMLPPSAKLLSRRPGLTGYAASALHTALRADAVFDRRGCCVILFDDEFLAAAAGLHGLLQFLEGNEQRAGLPVPGCSRRSTMTW